MTNFGSSSTLLGLHYGVGGGPVQATKYALLLANFRSVISVQIHSMSLESTLQTKPAWVDGSARQVKEGGRESGGRADGLM